MDVKQKSKPLVYFVLASIVAAIALIFAIGDRLRAPDQAQVAESQPAAGAATGQPADQQSGGTGDQSAGQSQSAGAAPQQTTGGETQTAAGDASQQSVADQPAAGQAQSDAPGAADEAAPVKPTFDIVRIEDDGGAVIAGRAQPGARITLRFGDIVIGEAIANERGEWVITPDKALPKGAHNLTIAAEGADGAVTLSDQVVSVSVPEESDGQPLIVLAENEKPSRVLQKPQGDDGSAQDTGQAAADAAEPDTALQQTDVAAVEPGADAAQQQTEPESTPARAAPLVLSAVDYNESGDILFSGTAAPGETVRVYVDNEYVGDAVSDADGNWVFRGQENISPGVHSLRIDQVGKDGRVAQRRELPFERARPERVAELNKPRSAADGEADQAGAATAEPSGSQQAAPQAPSQSAAAEPAQPAGQTGQDSTSGATGTQTASSEPAATATGASTGSEPAEPSPTAQDNASAQSEAQANGHVVIQPGNNLWNISRVIYGRGIEYTVIYEANKDQIRNPHRIYPGQIFDTPGVTPPEEIDPKRRTPLNEETGSQ